MNARILLSVLVLTACLMSGCGIFGSGCKCPKVSYKSYPLKAN